MKRTLVANWQNVVSKYGDKLAYRYKKNKVWVDYTYKEMDEMVQALAAGLLSFRLRKGDRIGIIADDCLEWMVTDMACQHIGCPDVPRGSDSTADEIEYILSHAETKIVFVENEKQLDKVISKIESFPKLQKIVVMDDTFQTDRRAIAFYDLIEKGQSRGEKGSESVKKISQSIEEEDLATIIYTSGTTGQPKGVMLRQKNFMHNIVVGMDVVHIRPDDHFLHILPVWHVFGRTLEYLQIGAGASGAYTNIRELGGDMRDQKPTFMGSAPRLWESIYQRILDNLKKGSFIKKNLFFAALHISKVFRQNMRSLQGNRLKLHPVSFGQEITVKMKNILFILLSAPVFPLADKILAKVREATGGRLRGTVSGGGALPLHIDEFFEAIGIKVLEGYGLTETSPVIAVRTFEKLIPGCVGPIMPESVVQIRDDSGHPVPKGQRGVVWVKGPQVMQGYYKNKEATDKVMVNGWFNTGDLGLITFNDTLKLMGRAKDTIVLLGGENVEPVPIENMLLDSPYISQVMAVGQDKKSLGALIVPDNEKLSAWCSDNGIPFDENNKNASYHDPKVQKLYADEIKTRISAATGFKGFERVTGFALIEKPFEVNDELTAIGKMKRHVITDKYTDIIEKMYQG